MFFYLCENLAGTWQQWYWLVNQNEEQLVYLSVNHNVNCNFSILCCWAWSILSSWWWPYCSTPSGNDDLSSHFWRHFLLNRQGCAADKHYSSSGVRGGQALFIAREEFFFQKLCHVKCRLCRLAAEIYPLVYSGFTSEMDLKLVRTSQQRYQNGLIKTE